MKNLFKQLTKLSLTAGLILMTGNVFSQCTNNNVLYTSFGVLAPGASQTISCTYGGEYLNLPVTSGSVYVITTCGGGSWDTQLTLFNGAATTVLGYNDDFCGLQSQITWTASFSGTLRIVLDQYYCTSNSSCMNVTVTRQAGAAFNPCASIGTLTCGTTATATLPAGAGAWSSYGGPFTTPGTEKIFTFTPTITGAHTFTVTHTSGYYVDLFYKVASGGCNNTGWTYVNDIIGTEASIITLTAGTTYYVMLDDENTTASTATINITCPSLIPYNPCSPIATVTCGTAAAWSNPAGAGVWNTYGGPFSVPGTERILQFTPTITGVHTVAVTNSGGYYVDLFYKASSGGCNSTGWTYLNDIYTGTESSNITLTAGTTYYLLLDDEDLLAGSGSVLITCPSLIPYNPCTSIANITTCGVATPVSIGAGAGAWDAYGGIFPVPGKEKIVSYTPTITGSYDVSVSHSGGYYVDLFYKASSGGCNSTGWTYLNDIFGAAETSTVTLTAGVTYYFMLDDEDMNASEAVITISCPCIGAAVDGVYSYSGSPLAITGNTTGACNNSALRPSHDLTYQINVGCAGSYTFSMCGGTAWDSYLYVTTAPGGGTTLAYDDDACGGIGLSTLTVSLAAGTYYTTVEGWAAAGAGPFTLNISGTGASPTIVGATATNTSCYGGSDGSISASANGNGNSATISLTGVAGGSPWTGLSAGTYTLVATNCWGSSSQTITVGQPTAVVASSSSGIVLCNGGTTIVTVSATGGTGAYNGTGSFTVGAGSYSYTVTDANGCSAVTNITVTEPEVLSASSTSTVILCNGGFSDVTVSANGGTAPYTGTGTFSVTAGTHTFVVTDDHDCSTSTTITISEPTAIVVDAGSDATVYPAYPPFACTTLSGSASGGTPGYIYEWSNGSNSTSTDVCPTVTTTYTLNVEDMNGCIGTDDVTVCAADISCTSSGGSGNEHPNNPNGNNHHGNGNATVYICHHTGNGEMTMCLPISAIADHLSHGDVLGECGEDYSCNGNASRILNANDAFVTMDVYPNPSTSQEGFNLRIVSGRDNIGNIDIIDISGKIVTSFNKIKLNAGELSTTFVKALVMPGIYVVRLTTQNGELQTLRIVVK